MIKKILIFLNIVAGGAASGSIRALERHEALRTIKKNNALWNKYRIPSGLDPDAMDGKTGGSGGRKAKAVERKDQRIGHRPGSRGRRQPRGGRCNCDDTQFCPYHAGCQDKISDGLYCGNNLWCASGNCHENTCECAEDSCPEGQFCDSNGECSEPLSIGSSCSNGDQCSSGNCHENTCECASNDHCTSGQYCSENTCVECYSNHHCASNRCRRNTCLRCTEDSCPEGQFCDVNRECSEKLSVRSSCSSHSSCLNNSCRHGMCACSNASCDSTQYCAYETACERGLMGYCESRNHGECLPKLENREVCTNDGQCSSGKCVTFDNTGDSKCIDPFYS